MFLICVKKIMGLMRMHIIPIIVIIALAITIPLVSFAIFSNSTEISSGTTEISEPTRNIIATTQVSETEVPTTEVSTTLPHTTLPVTTKASTTEVQTTQISTTKAPTTQIPTTEVPTIHAPTTQAPTTQISTTEVSTTQAPATQIPATEVRTTQAPEGKSNIELESSSYVFTPEYDEYEKGIYLGTFILTGYCPCEECWGNQIPSKATCVSGHTVACSSIPPGTWIYIDGLGEFQVEYTVSGLAPNVIGIFFDYHLEVERFGKQAADVYLMAY